MADHSPSARQLCYADSMTIQQETPTPPVPRHVQVKDLPEDLARTLHRVSYETGETKRDLIIKSLRTTYPDTK